MTTYPATIVADQVERLSQLAGMLGVAPTTVSLIVSDLSRKGVLVRREDDADRRRRIIDISPDSARGSGRALPTAHCHRHERLSSPQPSLAGPEPRIHSRK
jgi:DNA-binding MarR family transcriptional regulator